MPTYGQKKTRASTEGSGGADGVVIPLQVVGNGMYEVAYTVRIQIGTPPRSFSLQVDTGSSDLWLASSSCSSSPACTSLSPSSLYTPTSSSSSSPTDTDFTITYLRGAVAGPIFWDHVSLGPYYTIDNQALAAASTITDEPLSNDFSGILGLALPLNSVIAQQVPPVVDNNPDGAAWASNLFSITPTSAAPAARFLSLSLSRPGSDRVPALMGIGRHPSAVVPDPSRIRYSALVSDRLGTLYWKVTVRAITVYVDGVAKPVTVNVGRASNNGAGQPFPTAVLDSGIPFILATADVANGIYGALGVSPAADGQYYVPCKTPLNMSISLDNRPEIPLHPLDVTAEPPDTNQAQFCIGMIQVFQNPDLSGISDLILGVPFLRNTYTVMAYTEPFQNGSFPVSSAQNMIQPRLGLLPLTDPAVALDEFRTVRVLNQPISTAGGSGGAGGNNPSSNASSSDVAGPKKISVGVIVLIGLVGFFAVCCALFGLRWFLLKRRFNKRGATGGASPDSAGGSRSELALEEKSTRVNVTTTRTKSMDGEKKLLSSSSYTPLTILGLTSSFEDVRLEGTNAPVDDTEDHQQQQNAPRRRIPFPTTERLDSTYTSYTASSGRTRVGEEDEFGKHCAVKGSWGTKDSIGSKWSAGIADEKEDNTTLREEESPRRRHERNLSVSSPLLRHRHSHSGSFGSEGAGEDPMTTRAPVDIASAGTETGTETTPGSGSGAETTTTTTTTIEEKNDDMAEFGYNPPEEPVPGMAGIGSAARTRRRFEALPFPRTSSYYSVDGTPADPHESGPPSPPPSRPPTMMTTTTRRPSRPSLSSQQGGGPPISMSGRRTSQSPATRRGSSAAVASGYYEQQGPLGEPTPESAYLDEFDPYREFGGRP